MRVIHLHSFSRQAPTRRLESTSPDILIALSAAFIAASVVGVRVAADRFRLLN